jgi:hypothetical protein
MVAMVGGIRRADPSFLSAANSDATAGPPAPRLGLVATFYGMEIERPFFEAVQIAVGNRFYFTDAQLFGSALPQ